MAAATLPHAPVSATGALARAAVALAQVADTQATARSEGTNHKIHAAMAELQAWCLSSTPGDWGLSIYTIGPAEVLWFAVEEWLPKHAGGEPQLPLS